MQLEESYSPNVSEKMKLYPIFAPALPICRNSNFIKQPYFCHLVNRFENIPRISSDLPFLPSQDYSAKTPINRQARSYYGSYGHGGAPATPTYYPAFDPISVLASLAFLAFLLQSFASLFDRSRSIIPTIVSSSRDSSSELEDDIEERVMRALDEYAALENNLLKEKKEVTTTETESKR
ncbi:uncharacterized protein LOC117176072 isoform X2 [Belonocnema kinseyi]|nr:uncharacterized protein LOC117176072 isoform X2 [Belonocnema kinseyi]